jgi:hypothetical protein
VSWRLVRNSSANVATGDDELEGYMQLWANQVTALLVEEENDGRGMMWPVGRALSATYTLSFDHGADIDLTKAWPTELLVVRWWIFGMKAEPNRERLEQIARLHMDLRDGVAALKKLGLDYTRTLQAAD